MAITHRKLSTPHVVFVFPNTITPYLGLRPSSCLLGYESSALSRLYAKIFAQCEAWRLRGGSCWLTAIREIYIIPVDSIISVFICSVIREASLCLIALFAAWKSRGENIMSVVVMRLRKGPLAFKKNLLKYSSLTKPRKTHRAPNGEKLAFGNRAKRKNLCFSQRDTNSSIFYWCSVEEKNLVNVLFVLLW